MSLGVCGSRSFGFGDLEWWKGGMSCGRLWGRGMMRGEKEMRVDRMKCVIV